MSIYDKASLVQIPSGYKASGAKLYSVLPANGDGDFTVSADADATRVNSDGLIESTVANQARLSRNFIDGELQPDPFLLLEPSRQNYTAYSAQFDNSYWTKATSDSTPNPTVTANAAVSPDGGLNADRVQATAAPNNSWSVVKRASINTSATVGSKLQQSLYLKAYDSSQIGKKVDIYVYDFSNTRYLTVYNYTLTDDWQRVVVEHTISGSNTSTNIEFSFGKARNSAGGSLQAETATDFLVWGAQLEKGNYPTSYIPTSGSAVTRTQDEFENSFTGLTSTAATIFLDFETQGLDFNFARLFAVHDSVTSDGIYLGIYSTNTIGFFGIDGGSGLPDVKDTISFNERNKLVLSFDGSGNYKYSLNGSLKTGTYVGTSRQYDEIGRGNVIGGSSNNIQIHQIIVFDEVLSDSELENLTSYDSFGQMAKALLYTIE